MKSKRARLQQILVFTILSLGLIASLLLASKSQDIRKEAAAQSGFTFAVISDTHAGIDPSQFANFHKWANYNHTQAVKQIQTINPKISNFLLRVIISFPPIICAHRKMR